MFEYILNNPYYTWTLKNAIELYINKYNMTFEVMSKNIIKLMEKRDSKPYNIHALCIIDFIDKFHHDDFNIEKILTLFERCVFNYYL